MIELYKEEKANALLLIIMRFNEDGTIDMNIMHDLTGPSDHECFFNILEDNSGNLILSGSGLTNNIGWGNRAFLSKFSSNGKLDTSFGKDGFYCFDFGSSFIPIFQIGDKYITAGRLENYKIVSVNNDGSSGNDIYTCGIYYFQDMKLQGNNKLVFGGGSNMYNANLALGRIIID